MVIRYKALKKVKRNYDEVFTNIKETRGLYISDGLETTHIHFDGQQAGLPLNNIQVTIMTPQCTYSMDWNDFIKKVTN